MAANAIRGFSSGDTCLSCFKFTGRKCLLFPAASFRPLPSISFSLSPSNSKTLFTSHDFVLKSLSMKSHSFCRLRMGDATTALVSPKRAFRVFAVSAGGSGGYQQAESNDSDPGEAETISIKLPRRSLQVQFTCNDCGERTKRLINRLAYEKGVVFLQCAGCLQYHKFVDNLGLIVEYDLRNEMQADQCDD